MPILQDVVASLRFDAQISTLRETQDLLRLWTETIQAHQLNERNRFLIICEATAAPEVIEDE